MTGQVCKGATWCALMAEPGQTLCRYHIELPLLNSFETRGAWGQRRKREQQKHADAIENAARSDKKLETRGRR